MKNTKIEWCDHTVNLWWGCSEVSEACQNCYAREIAKRFKKDCWGKSARLFRLAEAIEELSVFKSKTFKVEEVRRRRISAISDLKKGVSLQDVIRKYNISKPTARRYERQILAQGC